MTSYEDALVWRMTGKISILSWILQQIQASPNESITIRVSDIKKAFGPEFENREDYSFSYAIKYQLEKYGIKTNLRTHYDGTKLLLLTYGYN